MKQWLITLIVLLLCFQLTMAQNSGKGIGVILGEPTGISLKFWQSDKIAIDGGLAWSFGINNKFHFHADYLFHHTNIPKEQNFILYYGPGLRLRMGDEDRIGIRGAIGVDYFFNNAPCDAFFEVVPILDLIPGTYFSFNAGIGFRYFFK